MNLLGLLLTGVLAVLAVRWLLARTPKQRERAAIRALLLECGGDQDLLERLLFSEMEREDGISFTEAARRARQRLTRDRR